jgi:predicted RNA-binding protein YlxR (DUF448 family)
MKRETPIDARPGTAKRQPERTCIACRQVKAKKELIRIVRTNEGIVIDSKGKQPGRGAYLCKTKECWEKGLKGNQLENMLRAKFTPEDIQRLKEYAVKL